MLEGTRINRDFRIARIIQAIISTLYKAFIALDYAVIASGLLLDFQKQSRTNPEQTQKEVISNPGQSLKQSTSKQAASRKEILS
jgi:hypothetical protein